MSKWNLEYDWSKVAKIIGTIFIILILDFKNGSPFGSYCLATHLIQILVLGLIISLFVKNKLKKKIYKWSLIVLIPSILALAMEDMVTNYQYEKTNQSLKKICIALDSYKEDNGVYPNNLELLETKYLNKIPKSGFGVFDSKIGYELFKENEYQLDYKVKFGYKCQAYDCYLGYSFMSGVRCN